MRITMKQPETPEAATRLRQAREAAGYASAAQFASAHGLTESTYRSHENGYRALTRPAAQRYAEFLGGGITWHWLLYGDAVKSGAEIAAEANRPRQSDALPPSAKVWAIQELDVRAGAGNGAAHDVVEAERVVAEWRVPRDMIRGHTSAAPQGIKIINVYGDSMVPDFMPGERVMVDTGDRSPSPPGVFVVWDGFGLVIKRLEMVPYSDPPMVRLISRNKEYSTAELPAEDVHINGRVIGKWLWT